MWIKAGLIMELSSSIKEFPLNLSLNGAEVCPDSTQTFSSQSARSRWDVDLSRSRSMLIRPKQSAVVRRALTWDEFHLIDAVMSMLSRAASDGIATKTDVTSAPSLSRSWQLRWHTYILPAGRCQIYSQTIRSCCCCFVSPRALTCSYDSPGGW